MRSVVRSERELVAISRALGAERVRGWSQAEAALAAGGLPRVSDAVIDDIRRRIVDGADPLGEAFCSLRSPEHRRPRGATYTPAPIVDSMLKWAARQGAPARIVDPGVGSGRFIVGAGRAFPAAHLAGVEIDPLAAMTARAALATLGLSTRAEVRLCDYRELALPPIKGRTFFLGNPPYVRHHLLGQRWKRWLVRRSRAHGLDASQLAGLHVHFFLATLEHAVRGDVGIFITAAEWLDVNYGSLVRKLLMGSLGARGIHVIEPTGAPFADAATTAVITCFEAGAKPRSVRVRRVGSLADLGALTGGRLVRRERLEAAGRWSPLTRPARRGPEGHVELGELCRVHRGQVTGSNRVWIAGAQTTDLPRGVLFPTVTKARELFAAGQALSDPAALRCVVDLPPDLDVLDGEARKRVEAFLRWARLQGAHESYIAKTRRAWWSVGLREPAPILATYMARRPPAFVRNLIAARHINIAHGLYPRDPMSDKALAALAAYLSSKTSLTEGRTYAGGLTKFEPREMERLPVPDIRLLEGSSALAQPA